MPVRKYCVSQPGTSFTTRSSHERRGAKGASKVGIHMMVTELLGSGSTLSGFEPVYSIIILDRSTESLLTIVERCASAHVAYSFIS